MSVAHPLGISTQQVDLPIAVFDRGSRFTRQNGQVRKAQKSGTGRATMKPYRSRTLGIAALALMAMTVSAGSVAAQAVAQVKLNTARTGTRKLN
jgi:hypothetical protein